MFLRVLAATVSLFLVSCGSMRLPMPEFSPYRIEIQQGNFVSQEMVSQLKLGMSKDQVRFVLGTPLIVDSFHADRWDYVFRRQRVNSRELEQRKLTVLFEDGKLKRIEGDVIPAASADAAAVRMPEAKPEPQRLPAPAAAPPSTSAAETSAEAAKPAPAVAPVAPDKSGTAPVPSSSDNQPQEKSWWERLKDKVKF